MELLYCFRMFLKTSAMLFIVSCTALTNADPARIHSARETGRGRSETAPTHTFANPHRLTNLSQGAESLLLRFYLDLC